LSLLPTLFNSTPILSGGATAKQQHTVNTNPPTIMNGEEMRKENKKKER